MSTLRELLVEIRDRNGRHSSDYRDAVAALDILDKADTTYGNEKTSPHPYWRIVWDADGIKPQEDSA